MLMFVFLAGIFVVLLVVAGVIVVGLRGEGLLEKRDQIALVHLRGVVMDARDIVDQLERYRKDDRVKAVVVRIDSPGGAVGPSQEIYRGLKTLQETKTVVASMGTVAASGGYYAACGAERIFANPGTITGSIGVIVQYPYLGELFDKLGIGEEVVKSGEFKDMGSPVRELSPEERELIQSLVDDVHGQFVEAVAESRDLPPEQVRALADGRIFSGRQAKELGLVDELGGLVDAMRTATELAGIAGEPQVIEPREERFSLLRLLLGQDMEGRLKNRIDIGRPFIGYLFRP